MAVPAVAPVVVRAWEIIVPLLAEAPLTPVWLTVQLNVVPATLLVKVSELLLAEQIV